MPLVIEGGRIPPLWLENNSLPPRPAVAFSESRMKSVRIALINNMPDSALEDTELQFLHLLNTASDGMPVRVKFFSLPGIPRGDRGLERLRTFYHGTDDLLNSHLDCLIITGTEPHHDNLREEPYWTPLAELLDWAQHSTISTVLSCLAAHAGVLYSDGISRRRLSDKRFGVYDCRLVCSHALTNGATDRLGFPHSRWNEVPEEALISCGYSVLTKSDEAGVDLFVKRKRKSLFVHFQGHPEYGARTLLKEYRRDIKRYIRGERETYPSMPRGYFDESATKLLIDFESQARSHPREETMAAFPDAMITERLQKTWDSSAVHLYRNWLKYVLARKAGISKLSIAGRASHHPDRRRPSTGTVSEPQPVLTISETA